MKYGIYLLVLLISNIVNAQEDLKYVRRDIDDEECNTYIPRDYKKIHPPPYTASDVPINVYTTLMVVDVDEVNEGTMDFRLHTYFTQVWNDSRLLANYTSQDCILDDCYKYIWTPDISFPSAKTVTNAAGDSAYFYVMADGSLYFTNRYSFKVGCLMDFKTYPFDTQNCMFLISFMQTADLEALLKWTDHPDSPFRDRWAPVNMMKNIEPLQFHLVKPSVFSLENEFYIENFTYLVANFTFVRRVTGSIVNIYAPSALIVAVSMVTFWIRVDAAPARVALSITSLLTLCTQVTQYKSQLPPVNYLTAMDIWLFACILTVFSTLLEFAVSYNKYTKHKENFSRRDVPKVTSQVLKRDAWISSDRSSADTSSTICCNLKEIECLDVTCRKLYPSIFIAFIVIYWIYFMKNT